MNNSKNLTIENAKIIFSNFSGVESVYNRKGNRNFCVVLNPDLANTLTKEGWNVKTTNPRNEEDDVEFYIHVTVKFDPFPPKIYAVINEKSILMNQTEMEGLDTSFKWREVENVDLILTPYHWEVNGKSGVKAYLKTMYVTLEQDELSKKYSDISSPEVYDDVPF